MSAFGDSNEEGDPVRNPGPKDLPWPPPLTVSEHLEWTRKTDEGLSVMEALEIMFERVESAPEIMAKATRVVKAERRRLVGLQTTGWITLVCDLIAIKQMKAAADGPAPAPVKPCPTEVNDGTD